MRDLRESPPSGSIPGLRRTLSGGWAALAFLTSVPIPSRWLDEAPMSPQRMLWWWGVAGGLIGGLAGGVVWLAALRLPWIACAAIGVVALVGLSGGLHLDGLLDTCDGLGSRAPRERALEIMKDSHVGAFGVIGACCLLMLKFSLVAGLGLSWGVAAVGAAPLAGRLSQVWVMRSQPYARPQGGMGGDFFAAVRGRHLVAVAACAVAGSLVWLQLPGVIALVACLALTTLCAAGITRRLGGHTGDTVGALSEITEVTFCLTVALIAGA